MILLLDNYDSFTYNLYQMVGSIEPDLRVVRNDAISVDEIRAMNPDGIIISPGPGRPEDSGVCPEVISDLRGEFPILGVCLGEQAICMTYGATVSYAKKLMHGKQSDTKIDTTCPLFRGLPEVIKVARYHSLAVVKETLKETGLTVCGITTDGEVMAVEDRSDNVYGLQFHPESIMTPEGAKILKNFIELTEK
ncbi:anthranilate synthase component II [Oribacterium sp. WCC10]|uniref:anthranilate synthase component II n=1 Tax=Oribacterium sp. WCC10 TaxID=1855343 RepID=UPI0008E3A19D|nr:aminodeoxychorismate/anthranilate synthase component II [Oribacterium sp. WCC10]SFG62077.1 anthranilate synthase component 2 [Oribacterium sp. WCC10]